MIGLGDILDTAHCQCGGELEFSEAFPHLVSCSRCHYGGNLDAMARVIRPSANEALTDLRRFAKLSRRREQQWVGRLSHRAEGEELDQSGSDVEMDDGIFVCLHSMLRSREYTVVDYQRSKKALIRRQRQDGLRRR